jgi:hypothetical protein
MVTKSLLEDVFYSLYIGVLINTILLILCRSKNPLDTSSPALVYT